MKKFLKQNQQGITLSVTFARAQRGAASILMVFFVLTVTLLISATSATIMISEIKMSQEITNSIPAFYAADSGAERCLFQARCAEVGQEEASAECKDANEAGPSLNQQCAKKNGSILLQTLWDSVSYKAERQDKEFTAEGFLGVTQRRVEVNWQEVPGCASDCTGRLCGEDDGCGSPCPSTCFSFPGCLVSQPANTTLAAGSCCSGQCYQCAAGYIWKGSCVADFFDAETLDSLHWSDIKAYIDSKFPSPLDCTAGNTNWGAGLYGCVGSNKRCYGGSCITCGGWMNAGYCWYYGVDQSCTSVCSTRGGVYGGTCDWVNDPISCSTCLGFCGGSPPCSPSGVGPMLNQPCTTCYYHQDGTNNCAWSSSVWWRLCACEL